MTQEFVQSKIKSDTVAVFIKPTCPYCQSAMRLLSKYPFKKGHLEFIDITTQNDMTGIQNYFQQTTGARTVPRVYIGEVCIGGYSDLAALEEQEKLSQELMQIGALQ
ncbi:glutaredoxin-1 [Pelodiscus sinensis]|uniref:Glutaredoxin-1 n=1 Tax=Pelodiscus sinensis TaxID=13735 RepID=K7GHE9_PELSI|nr:glutaredoxin-1 [Pelodiscus sinensis]XP_025038197.1 glutaredoxin-1 [Pelodiscus sinensis]|eukprot:XP_006118735.1 glutaredoxin-1 [Pelodiscus sinensis]